MKKNTSKLLKYLSLIVYIFSVNYISSQTTYTFTHVFDSSWSNVLNWSPSYPGEIIGAGDTVIIANGASCNILSLDIINNGTIIVNGDLMFNNATSKLTNNGTMQNTGYIFLLPNGFLTNNGYILNDGSIQGLSYLLTNNLNAIIDNNSQIIYNGGTLINEGVINNNDTGRFLLNGTISNNNSINNYGHLEGNGVLDPNNYYSSGLFSIIEPQGAATLTSYGDLDMESTSLNINIDGANQVNGVFVVVGNAIIEDAKLDIIWTEPPTANASYTVMTFTSRTGVFSTVNIPPVTGFNFNVVYTDTEVNIEVTENGLGVDDLIIKDNIVFWPNPTDDFLNIDLSDYKDEVVIEILNVFGKEIYNKTHVNQQVISTNLNVDAGIYFVNLIDEKKNKKTFKIVKK